MNIDKIKSISIVDWLDKNGYKRQRGSGKYYSYYSPFSPEKDASFKVNTAKNTFLDYHADARGDIIDLVMGIENCDFKTACGILSDDSTVDIKQHEPKKSESGVKIHSVGDITDKELIDYFLGARKIDEMVLRHYCKQVEFSFPFSDTDSTRVYKAIGFQNDLKGFELRGSWMRVASAPKSFTTIRGTNEEDDKVVLFEAWVDFLSYLTHNKIPKPFKKTYVLNGARMIGLLNPFLEGKTVYSYVDADRAGDEIHEAMDKSKVVDCRNQFLFYKDYNEWLQSF